jgi:hypothetical protein
MSSRPRWLEDPFMPRLVLILGVAAWGGASWIAFRVPFVLGVIVYLITAALTVIAAIWMIRESRRLSRRPTFRPSRWRRSGP